MRLQAKEPLLGAYLAVDAEDGNGKKKKKKKKKSKVAGDVKEGLEEAILEKLRAVEEDQENQKQSQLEAQESIAVG